MFGHLKRRGALAIAVRRWELRDRPMSDGRVDGPRGQRHREHSCIHDVQRQCLQRKRDQRQTSTQRASDEGDAS